MSAPPPLRAYSRAERVSDAAIHLVGLIGAAMAVPFLITLAVVQRGDWPTITAISIYGATLTAMLGFSAIYNILGEGRWTPVLKRMDHSAIYLKIAGTYTPLVALTGGAGLPLLAGLWTAALGGTSLKILAPDRLKWLGLALYLGMGWAGLLAGWDVIGALSPLAFGLVLAGGCLYTLGVAFFLWQRLPFHITIWHGFVLVASALFYGAILVQLGVMPAAHQP